MLVCSSDFFYAAVDDENSTSRSVPAGTSQATKRVTFSVKIHRHHPKENVLVMTLTSAKLQPSIGDAQTAGPPKIVSAAQASLLTFMVNAATRKDKLNQLWMRRASAVVRVM